MRTSKARVTGGSKAGLYRTVDGGAALGDLATRGARYIAAVLATLMLAAVTLVVTPGGVARADTVFQSGDVFASVGSSTVNMFDTSGNSLGSLVDSTNELYTAGTVFDSSNNLYVADDLSGDISEFSPSGAPMGQFATGLTNPVSLVFDSQGNLYVGQQSVPYIAEFSPTGQRLADIGLVSTEIYGPEFIDLASDQCTFYYTSEGNYIERYNKCTNTQLPDFNQVPLPGYGAFELRILSDGDVLVADSSDVFLLDQNGNVIQDYSCNSLPNCQGGLFAVTVAPDGTSFWTGDAYSGFIYQVDIASGNVLQTINAHTGSLFGLSVDGQVMAATTPTVVAATPTALSTPSVSTPFSYGTPTTVSAVLTDTATDTPISNEQVTFTLNGSETCTGTTDSTGTADCVITPSEPSATYTLSDSFPGDSNNSISSTSNSTSTPVETDTSTLTYTGPTTASNGQTTTLSGTLTSDNPPGSPLDNQVVTFTLGSGPTAQTCSGTTDIHGNVNCPISPVDQPVSNVTVTANYAGSPYETTSGTQTPFLVTEPTTLTVHSATGDFADTTPVSGTLTDSLTNQPIPGEQVTLQLDANESCTATTDATGTASCLVTPSEPAATYPLTGSFGGNTALPLELLPSTGSSNFVVTLEQTWLTYTGPTIAQNGQSLALSGVLTTDDPALGAPISGRTVTFVLGSGASAQTCSGVTDTTGTAACTINSVSQAPGPIPVTDTFAGDAYYQTASASSTVNLPEETQLTVNPVSGSYNGSTPVSGTLINTYTGLPVPGQPVTLTVNGTQSCAATTNAQGVATCDISPNEPAGSYSLSGSFPGNQTSQPQLLPSDQSSTFTVTQAPTTVTYTGPTTVTNGQPVTLSGVVTSSEPTSGTPVGGETVTFTVGSGSSSQSCTGTSLANGDVSCTVPSVNQTSGYVDITTSVSGNSYYQSSSTSAGASVQSPTTLTVSATTGQYGGATTVTGTLTNSATGQPVAGQTVTLNLNSTQSCTAVTGSNGKASCSITPNEPAGSYPLSGSFGGATPSTGPTLLSSTGSNTFVVTKAPTTVTNTSPTIAVSGLPITLTATISTAGGSGPGGLPVTLTLGSGSTSQSCTGTASATGVVSCTISDVNQTAGTVPLTVTFGSNSYYQSSSTSVTETTASFAGGGGGVVAGGPNPTPSGPGFVVGDISADGTTGKPVTGTTVNFWGSQTWKTNQFSGVNNAPASMKGYIDNLANYACGAQWTSDPGNSSAPPSTIPVNMVVVVASTITQSGSTEAGNTVHLAIVHVAPGYGPAPGHAGYGEIIGYIC